MKATKVKSQMPAVEVVLGKAVATYDALVSAIENLVSDARTGLKAAMNAIMLQTYWHTMEVRAVWDDATNGWFFLVLDGVGALNNGKVEGEWLCVK